MDDDLRERDIDSCIIKFLLDGYIQFILRREVIFTRNVARM